MERAADLSEVCCITAAPALAMALGSAAVSMGEPSEMLQCRLQKFSAGLLIGAVVTEIFPILKLHIQMPVDAREVFHATEHGYPPPRPGISWFNLIAAVVGFSSALVLMYAVKALDLEGGDHVPINDSDQKKQPLLTVEGTKSDMHRSASTDGAVWINSVNNEERAKLKMWLARLHAHAGALAHLVESEEVDREAVDEEVHGIDFLVDSARRLCRGAEPLDRRNTERLRHHVGELIEDVAKLRKIDGGQLAEIDKHLRITAATLRHVHAHAEKATFRRWAPRHVERGELSHSNEPTTQIKLEPMPVGLILAVVLDSGIDGMLIGLASSVAASSGLLMAIATIFEMGFLGYSFACSVIKAARNWKAVIVLGTPPVAMLFASLLAKAGAQYLEHSPAFSGLIAFALAAVLFLVVQELLEEANEKEGAEEWHVSAWLYIGLLVSIGFELAF